MAFEVRYITPDNGRVAFDLMDNQNNIVLHMSARWDQKVLVLNTCKNGVWGPEETVENFNFNSGIPITLRAEAKTDCFTIIVNGTIVHNYKHRMPLTSITRARYYVENPTTTPKTTTVKTARLISIGVFY